MELVTLLFIFLLITIAGVSISKRIFQDTNSLFLLGSGMLIGPLGLLLIAGITSYILKGFTALTIVFFCYIMFAIYWGNSPFKLKNLHSFSLKFLGKSDLLLTLLIVSYVYLFFLIASTFNLGGDVDVYFGLTTSFARGNYPSYLPWQPDFLSSYHMGVFIVEGVIYGITQISIYSIHSFFSAYIISALFLLITGIAKGKCNSVVSILPAIFGVIMFGVPVVLIGGYGQFFSNFSAIKTYPQYFEFMGSLASGTSDFFGHIYRNFYPFSLATFILALYSLALHPWKDQVKKKYILVTILLVLTISIDESFFLPELLIGCTYFLIEFKKHPLSKMFKLFILLFIIFTALFFLIQNSLRDALLNPSLESARFKFIIPGNALKSSNPRKFTLIPGDQEYMQYFNQLDEEHSGKSAIGYIPMKYFWKNLDQLKSQAKQIGDTVWVLPNILFTAALTLLLSLLIKSKMATLLSISAFATMTFSLFTVYTFFPPTSIRFIHQSSQLLSIALGFIFINIWRRKSSSYFKIGLLLLIIVVFGPQIISSHVRLINYYFANSSINYFGPPALAYKATLNNIRDLVPYDGRIAFLYNFPLGDKSSGMVAEAISRFGFFVPISPPDVKLVSPEAASEWLDVTLSLNPPTLKKLGIEYVFIQNPTAKRLKDYGVDVQDPNFFIQIYSDQFGILYKVTPNYLSLPDQPFSLDNFMNSLPKEKTVYLDTFDLVELRRGLVLRLAKKNNLIGPGFSAGGDYFLYIETFLPFTYICDAPYLPKCSNEVTKNFNIEYIIAQPNKDTKKVIDGDFTKIKETPLVVLWQRR